MGRLRIDTFSGRSKKNKKKHKGPGQRGRERRARARKRPRAKMVNDPASRHYVPALDFSTSRGGKRETTYGRELLWVGLIDPRTSPQFVWPKSCPYTKHQIQDAKWMDMWDDDWYAPRRKETGVCRDWSPIPGELGLTQQQCLARRKQRWERERQQMKKRLKKLKVARNVKTSRKVFQLPRDAMVRHGRKLIMKGKQEVPNQIPVC